MKVCPKCKIGLNIVFPTDDIWSDEYLICPECDGTYWLWDESLEIKPIYNLEGRNLGG